MRKNGGMSGPDHAVCRYFLSYRGVKPRRAGMPMGGDKMKADFGKNGEQQTWPSSRPA
ncbi:protein of unknown function [Magnetospirillum sp. XM-1]|nr:protein of unknown function [Magnetospirillum sp. XM-1]